MSDDRKSSLREVARFDYKVFNDKGVKVPLSVPKVTNMDQPKVSNLDQFSDSEEKLKMKIKRHINENEVDLLFDVSDIEDAISDIRSLTNSFEDVHVALRRELKDQYKEKYPDYDKQIEDIAKWVKEAKKAIKEKKQASFVSHRDPVAQAKTRLKTEEKHLRAKIECEITTFNEENSRPIVWK